MEDLNDQSILNQSSCASSQEGINEYANELIKEHVLMVIVCRNTRSR